MKLVGPIASALTFQRDLSRHSGTAESSPAVSAPSRALTVTQRPVRPAANAYPAQQSAAFLAHLIAMKTGHPQTRERRKADPGDVLDAYRAASHKPVLAGKFLSQAM